MDISRGRQSPQGGSGRRQQTPGLTGRERHPYTLAVHQQILAAFVEAARQVFQGTDIAIESVEQGDALGGGAQDEQMRMAAFGELSNQVSGRAITILSEKRLRCDITAPAVIAATELRSLVPDLAVRFQKTIRGPFGRLTMFLGMQDTGALDRGKKTS